MGIRLESQVFGSGNIDSGQRNSSCRFRGDTYVFTLDGAGPGLGGHYFVRKKGRFVMPDNVIAEGFLAKGISKDIFIFGRSITFTGT